MNNRKIGVLTIILLSFVLVLGTDFLFPETKRGQEIASVKSTIEPYGVEFNPVKEIKVVETVMETEPEIEEVGYSISEDDIELIALVTMAEAEGEPEVIRRLPGISTVIGQMNQRLPDKREFL